MTAILDRYVQTKQQQQQAAAGAFFELAVRLARGDRPKTQTIDKAISDAGETTDSLLKVVNTLSEIKDYQAEYSKVQELSDSREELAKRHREGVERRKKQLEEFERQLEAENHEERSTLGVIEGQLQEAMTAGGQINRLARTLVGAAEQQQLEELYQQRHIILNNASYQATIDGNRLRQHEIARLDEQIQAITSALQSRIASVVSSLCDVDATEEA